MIQETGPSADLIDSDPATGAGVAYVRLETDPDPVRVRAAWVTDADITALCKRCAPVAVMELADREAGAAA